MLGIFSPSSAIKLHYDIESRGKGKKIERYNNPIYLSMASNILFLQFYALLSQPLVLIHIPLGTN